jgi:N-acetylglucosaminyl-diphospho-decaprenol L-rhamnosyltransferase
MLDAHPRCGVAGPQMLYSDGTLAGVAAQLPDRRRRRSSGARRCAALPAAALAARHYLLDAPTDEPVQADTMLGAFLLLRRAMLDEIGGWDAGYRMYCEDIDLNYRAAKAGWERWYVPAAVVRHEYAAVIDKNFLTRHTLWHARRCCASCASIPSACSRG